MTTYLQTSVNSIAARAMSLQQSMIVHIATNRDEESCGYLGIILEQVAELATELIKLQSFLKVEIKEPTARSPPDPEPPET